MKMNFIFYILLALVISFTSCKKDNYTEPGSFLTGKLVYNNEPINVEYDQVNLQIWQFGFGKKDYIASAIGQDGSFSSLLFDGNYRLVFAPNQGPFMTKIIGAAEKDTIFLALNGSQILNIDVIPYYMVKDASFTSSAGVISATCKLDKIITDDNAKTVERITLYINKTNIVSGSNYYSDPNISLKKDVPAASITALNDALIATATANVSAADLTLTMPVFVPTQTYVFARIGLKISGVEKLIFSPITKIIL